MEIAFVKSSDIISTFSQCVGLSLRSHTVCSHSELQQLCSEVVQVMANNNALSNREAHYSEVHYSEVILGTYFVDNGNGQIDLTFVIDPSMVDLTALENVAAILMNAATLPSWIKQFS